MKEIKPEDFNNPSAELLKELTSALVEVAQTPEGRLVMKYTVSLERKLKRQSDANLLNSVVREDERERIAQLVDSYGDECAGGAGDTIVPSGPNKGQRYGEAYYNLAAAIRKLPIITFD